VHSLLKSHLADTVTHALLHTAAQRALVIFDRRSELSRLLADGYAAILPEAGTVDFDQVTQAEVLARIGEYESGDLVVMIESTRFDIREFRFRLELFRRGLRVIEHPHLGMMAGDEVQTYVEALAYDAVYYRGVGTRLKERIDRAREIRVVSPGGTLGYRGPFEQAKLNVGDYAGMASVGGQFPIGEVFTEPVDLAGLEGAATLFAFGDTRFRVNAPSPPFPIEIVGGRLVAAPGASGDFEDVLAAIRAGEGDIRVRELGFGLNRAFTPERRVTDVGSYERMCGVHLSLGGKHNAYRKHGQPHLKTGAHVDVFVAVDKVHIDGETVFERGAWTV
jgi:aminopeptidase